MEEVLKWLQGEKINFLPLKFGEKVPALKSWKPLQDRKIRTTEINRYFRGDKKHNIAIICGLKISDGLFVLDFDTEEIFEKFFPDEEKRKNLCLIKTGRGYHALFKSDREIKPLKCFSEDGKEILTLKSTGGYTVFPPSKHPNGWQYALVNPLTAIEKLGGDVRQVMKDRAQSIGLNFGNAEGNEEIDIEELLKGAPRGGQDNTILMISNYIRRQGSDLDYALRVLMKWRERCNPVIPEGEIREKCQSHYDRPDHYSFYYLTDPAKQSINLDLTLEESNTEDEDVFYKDTNGRTKIQWDYIEEDIRKKYIFKTFDDTEEILYFVNGMYAPADILIKIYLKKKLGTWYDWRTIRKLEDLIRGSTYTSRALFDTDQRYLPLENGLLNFSTGELEAFNSEKLFTSNVPIRYEPEADYKWIEDFVSQVVHKDDINAVQEMFGYSIYNGMPAHKLFWLTGTGGNGKTTLGDLLALFVGVDNTAGVPLTQFDGGHNFAIARLFGKRLNLVAEPETKYTMQTEILKAAVGGDLLYGEMKRVQKTFAFRNTAKMVVYANKIPRINDSSYAFKRRLLVIDFPNTFGEKNSKKDYATELIEEHGLSGLLNWALLGLQRLVGNNWVFSDSVQQRTARENFLRVSQPVLSFLEEWTEYSVDEAIEADNMYNIFNGYCEEYLLAPLNENMFKVGMRQSTKVQIRREMIDGKRAQRYYGIKLKSGVATYLEQKEINAALKLDYGDGQKELGGIEDYEPTE
jgi:putative DNA primase/helicase